MPTSPQPFEVGTKVLLRVCPYGQPGTVLRVERNRAVVLWHDLDYLARHQPESLMEAKNAAVPLQKPLQHFRMLVYPPFRARYNQYRKVFNLMRAAMGYLEYPAIDELQ
jgi:hypothetical protein